MTIEDMEDDIKPILKREPDFITTHLGTNNVISIIFNVILNKLLHLKSTIIDVHKIIEIIIFEPMMRIDNGKATLSNIYFCNLLEEVNTNIVKNKNNIS